MMQLSNKKGQCDTMRKKTEGVRNGDMMRIALMLFSIMLVVSSIASAGGQSIPEKVTGSTAAQADSSHEIKFADIERNITCTNSPGELTIKPKSMTEIYLSLGVLAFGLILVIFTGFFVLRKNASWDQEATRVFAISVIITAGLFLITAGYSDRQIAPMFGLLGTIVGYLLGKSLPQEQNS